MTEGNDHKTIESPWTKRKYVIRALDPVILTIFSRPENQEIRNIRVKIQDVLDDIKREENRQKQTGQKDPSKLDVMNAQLQSYYKQLQERMPLDEKELENRKKILQYGLVQPKIKTDDDYLDLGIDASFIYASIVGQSQVSDDYGDVIQSLFRQGESTGSKGGQGG